MFFFARAHPGEIELKITKLELTHVFPRWLFLRLHTDEGLVGYGEPIVEGQALTVEAARARGSFSAHANQGLQYQSYSILRR